jgi:molybdopterin synthase sulfur carrier subunit
VKLLYFAWVRQKVGVSQEDYTPPEGVTTVAQLIDALRARGPNYAEAFADTARLRCAVNQTHRGFDAAVAREDEIAFFPPVTGG